MDTWHERTSPLDLVSQLVWGEEKKEGEIGTERERNLFRERSSLLSKIFSDRTIGFQRGKKQSFSPRQGLLLGTSFGEFRKTPEGSDFSPTCFTLCLRVVLMGRDFLRPGWPWFRYQKIWTE